MTPTSGSIVLYGSQTFTFQVSDTFGIGDINMFEVSYGGTGPAGVCQIQDSFLGGNGFSSGYIFLENDAGNGLLSPLGSWMQNSQCVVTLVSSTVSGDGNTATVVFGLAFNADMAGTFPIYVTATGYQAGSAPWIQAGTWTVTTSGLSVSGPFPLPNATAGVTYVQTLIASGGTGPYTWAPSDSPPNGVSGLTLSSSGVLSGIPLDPGT